MYILYPYYIKLDNLTIPIDEDNSDYRKYLEWVNLGNTPDSPETPKQIMSRMKAEKQQEIRDAHEIDCLNNVNHGDLVFQGGFESAIKLDAAKRLAEAAGMTEVTFYDATNNARIFSIQEALIVVLTVASNYQEKLARKQKAMIAIDSAKTVSKINAVAY